MHAHQGLPQKTVKGTSYKMFYSCRDIFSLCIKIAHSLSSTEEKGVQASKKVKEQLSLNLNVKESFKLSNRKNIEKSSVAY